MANATKKPQQYEGSATVIVKSSYHIPYILLNYSNRTTENALWSKELTSKSKFSDDNHSLSQSSLFTYRINLDALHKDAPLTHLQTCLHFAVLLYVLRADG